MDKFIELLKESVLIQSTITVVVVVGAVIQILHDGHLSPDLQTLVTLVIGFYFGAKSTNSAKILVEKVTDAVSSAQQ